eukprot:CAMPEP_0194257912 /NCGR_PEP_ID=MMETSP0158-20130606/40125_1 /TAXON_ID=33649 /ORGANISM="Thalassionema nitzschioides, Strain L26-B" /LENGTH=37 /DNA_ID= /DNA_START= /DNA_END= /DNA_ORIENTATION=
MTEEDDMADKPQELITLCRLHDIGRGSGFVIVAAPND